MTPVDKKPLKRLPGLAFRVSNKLSPLLAYKLLHGTVSLDSLAHARCEHRENRTKIARHTL
jgi:hypothetical protein